MDPVRRRALQSIASLVGVPVLGACGIDRMPAATPRRASANARPLQLRARPSVDGQGAQLQRLFPQMPQDHVDPFVLFDDFGVSPPAGFPTHPHRGFEAFTYMLDGAFRHHDNLGNESEVSTGGVQLFTSGRGAWHSEMPGRPSVNRGIQLWVNLPQRLKRIEPAYAAHHGRDIPEQSVRGVRVRTVVGPQSPVRLQTSVRYLDVALSNGQRWTSDVPPGWRSLAYLVDGHARIGDLEFERGQAAILRPGEVSVLAMADARVIFLAGAPHDEPIHQHGPYVD